jgi:hypothetical protein
MAAAPRRVAFVSDRLIRGSGFPAPGINSSLLGVGSIVRLPPGYPIERNQHERPKRGAAGVARMHVLRLDG